MKQFRTPKPGDRAGRVADFRALADEVARLGNFDVDGAALESDAGGQHLILPAKKPAFWARLTAEYADSPGVYTWIEQERSALGTFSDLAYGRYDDGLSPAIEANRTSGLPTDATAGVGAYVWLELGYGLPVTGGVVQEWIFRHGGGGGGEGGFWARIESANCTEGSFRIIEIVSRTGGTWEDKAGGVDSSIAYHAQKGVGPYASGGPLVAAGTRVWVRKGFNDGAGTQEYVFDCPAGFTGTSETVGRWRCVSGVPEVLPYYTEMWNGQVIRQPSHLSSVPPCDPWTPPPP